MQLHEFQAKDILRRYQIDVPLGRIALTPDEAAAAARQINSESLFVKAQILAGDRAAAGGVRAVRAASGARAAASELLGRKLVTSQTGPGGYTVKRVLVEAAIDAAQELYLALRVDLSSGSVAAIAGPHRRSGVERHLATGAPDFQTLTLGVDGERRDGDIADFCGRIGLVGDAADKFRALLGRLHRAFVEVDAALIEINPLILTKSGELVAADVKLAIDDNAVFRHPDIAQLRNDEDVDQVQLQAQRHQINYVLMDGDVGIVVNGAGLGLATLDMVRAAGGSPANFMDIRTTAKSLDIAHGIGMILDNPRAKVLLVNVYGGGMQSCDTIVDGLGIAFRRSGRVMPVVLRITGNSENFARMRLANFNLPKTECADMWQAATRATAIAQGRA
ncbi:MAG: acetate--CoA ligase family protein [Alphaproteobacteria bacterium]|nr:acetate--CoA ligase family protein [Alphaproteobacteria bacterium]